MQKGNTWFMKYIITGRTCSGVTTLYLALRDALAHKQDISLYESSLEGFLRYYEEGDKVIVVDTAAYLCQLRAEKKLTLDKLAREGTLLTYVTELPYCTIVSNNLSYDDFKVQIKRLAKKL